MLRLIEGVQRAPEMFQSPSEVSDVLSYSIIAGAREATVSIPFRGFRRAEQNRLERRLEYVVSIPFRGFRRAEPDSKECPA